MTGRTTPDKERRSIYTALEDLDFLWSLKEVHDVEYLWKEGRSLEEISKYMKREVNEVFVLLFDRAIQGKIKQRPGSIFGVNER